MVLCGSDWITDTIGSPETYVFILAALVRVNTSRFSATYADTGNVSSRILLYKIEIIGKFNAK